MSSSASKIPSASTLIEEFKRTCGSTTELDQTEAAVLCLWLIWQTNHAAEKTTQGVSTRYARVSTGDRDTAVQVSVLKTSGCERIYWEKASGGRWDRPELHRLLDQLRKGDVLVVWKLDRLSPSP